MGDSRRIEWLDATGGGTIVQSKALRGNKITEKDLKMKHRHLIAALIAVTPVAVFAQAGAPGTPPPGGGVSPSGATESAPPIQTTQDPATGRAVPDTVPPASDMPPEAMQPSGQPDTTTTAPTENPAMTTGDGVKPKKEKKPRR